MSSDPLMPEGECANAKPAGGESPSFAEAHADDVTSDPSAAPAPRGRLGLTARGAVWWVVGAYLLGLGFYAVVGLTRLSPRDFSFGMAWLEFVVRLSVLGWTGTTPLMIGLFLAWSEGSRARRWTLGITGAVAPVLTLSALAGVREDAVLFVFIAASSAGLAICSVILACRLLQAARFRLTFSGRDVLDPPRLQFTIRGLALLTMIVAVWLGLLRAVLPGGVTPGTAAIGCLAFAAVSVILAGTALGTALTRKGLITLGMLGLIAVAGGIVYFDRVKETLLAPPSDTNLAVIVTALLLIFSLAPLLFLRLAGFRLVRVDKTGPSIDKGSPAPDDSPFAAAADPRSIDQPG